MQRFGGVARDTSGNALANTTIDVFLSGTVTAATIYSSNAYAALSNPFLSNVDGSWFFYAAPGRYDVRYTKANFSFGTAPTYDQLSYDYMSVITPAQITATQNDYAPTNGLSVEQWRLSTDAARTITGIAATTAVSGQSLTIFNVGSFPVTLAESNGGSSPSNQIITGVGDLTLLTGESAMLKYDLTSTRWRTIASPITTTTTNLGETLTGLGLTNSAGDLVNDIDIAVGACTSDDAVIANRNFMSLTSVLTKRLDANWVVGTNQGGLDTGAIANTTYHIFIIKRLDTNVVDALFSTSPTAPTMPANYTKQRRIGSILRVAGAIVLFTQDGDYFRRSASILDVNTTNPGTSAVTATLSVPTGINVEAMFNAQIVAGGSGVYTVFSDLAAADETPSVTVAPLGTMGVELTAGAILDQASGGYRIRTNTSAQIRYRLLASAAGTIIRIATLGWVDRRGRG